MAKDRFTVVGINNDEANEIKRPTLNYWKDSWRRFKENKVAMLFLFILIAILALVLLGDKIFGYDFNNQDYSKIDLAPSAKHIFGTDSLGRDLFTRVWRGGRTSLSIAFVGTAFAITVGALYGAISGYFGGVIDNIMMRIIEIISSVPYEVLVLLFLVVLPKGTGTLILAICITSWTGLARMIRGQIMQLKQSEYVLASKALGQSSMKLVVKHLLPNTMGIIIINLTMDIPGFIFAETMLSYLGLGVQAPDTSWGLLISQAQSAFLYHPHELLFPAGVLGLAALAFNLVGEGLRDALDPKLRQ